MQLAINLITSEYVVKTGYRLETGLPAFRFTIYNPTCGSMQSLVVFSSTAGSTCMAAVAMAEVINDD